MGMDVDGDPSNDIDIFIGVSPSSASAWEISVHDAGTGANTSPSTTSINTTPTWSSDSVAGTLDWAQVTAVNDPTATNFDLDAGGQADFFLSFKLPFADLVNAIEILLPGTNFNDTKATAYIAATSSQANSLNADLNGVDGGTSSTTTWDVLGALSPLVDAYGTPIPEPSDFALWLGAFGAGAILLRRRRKN